MGVGDARPAQRDTIFRIASITKPVAAVAALILVEECKLRLDDPIHGSRFYGTDMGVRDPFGNAIRILQQGN
jgi:hypothetical protein